MLKVYRSFSLVAIGGLIFWCIDMHAAELPVVPARVATPPVHEYGDAPATPDADDPAIWVHPQTPAQSLVLGTLKNAGLIVYNLHGRVVQTITPPKQDSKTPIIRLG